MEFEFIILLCIILFFASLVHGSIGFGFPMVATPLIALNTDMQTAIIYTLIPTLLVNIMSIISVGNIIEAVKKFFPLMLYATFGSIIGTFILINFNSDIMKILLAVAILFYLLLDFVKIKINWIYNEPLKAKRLFGTLAGLLGGLTNAMAPVLIVYTLESRFSKKEIIQATNLCFFIGKIIQIIIFTFVSAFTINELSISTITLIFVALALFFGIKIRNRIGGPVYIKIIKLLLFIIAIFLIWQTL